MHRVHRRPGGGGRHESKEDAAADNALKNLSKFCHTVVMNPNQGQMDRSSVVSREQIQGQAVQMKEEQSEPMGSGSVVSNMMKMMGWTEGSGLGFDDCKEIRVMRKRNGLSESKDMDREQRSRRFFLVLSKKISSGQSWSS